MKKEKFIQKAFKKYGNQYDYSYIHYINSTEKIKNNPQSGLIGDYHLTKHNLFYSF